MEMQKKDKKIRPQIMPLFALLAVIVSGCSRFTEQQEETRKKGIINAVYTTLEYSPSDKDKRINNYLELNVKNKHITESEKGIIILCINRTLQSAKWRHSIKDKDK